MFAKMLSSNGQLDSKPIRIAAVKKKFLEKIDGEKQTPLKLTKQSPDKPTPPDRNTQQVRTSIRDENYVEIESDEYFDQVNLDRLYELVSDYMNMPKPEAPPIIYDMLLKLHDKKTGQYDLTEYVSVMYHIQTFCPSLYLELSPLIKAHGKSILSSLTINPTNTTLTNNNAATNNNSTGQLSITPTSTISTTSSAYIDEYSREQTPISNEYGKAPLKAGKKTVKTKKK